MRALFTVPRFVAHLAKRAWLWISPSPEEEILAQQLRKDFRNQQSHTTRAWHAHLGRRNDPGLRR